MFYYYQNNKTFINITILYYHITSIAIYTAVNIYTIFKDVNVALGLLVGGAEHGTDEAAFKV